MSLIIIYCSLFPSSWPKDYTGCLLISLNQSFFIFLSVYLSIPYFLVESNLIYLLPTTWFSSSVIWFNYFLLFPSIKSPLLRGPFIISCPFSFSQSRIHKSYPVFKTNPLSQSCHNLCDHLWLASTMLFTSLVKLLRGMPICVPHNI